MFPMPPRITKEEIERAEMIAKKERRERFVLAALTGLSATSKTDDPKELDNIAQDAISLADITIALLEKE